MGWYIAVFVITVGHNNLRDLAQLSDGLVSELSSGPSAQVAANRAIDRQNGPHAEKGGHEQRGGAADPGGASRQKISRRVRHPGLRPPPARACPASRR